MRTLNRIGLSCLALSMTAGAAFAQNAPDNNQPPPMQQQGRPDPAAMRQMMIDNIKQQLGMSDGDFAAIQPEVEKIMQLQREVNFRPMMGFGPGGPGGPPGGGFGGPGGPGGPGGGFGGQRGPGGPGGFGPPPQQDQAPSDVQLKADKLRQVANDTGASAQDIKAALDDLRDARNKARENLAKARQDLIQLLSSHQEAVLVSMGIVE